MSCEEKSDQLDLRLSNVLYPAGRLSLVRRFLSQWMVRRIARNSDVGAVRDTHRGQTMERPSEPATRIDYHSDRDRRLDSAAFSVGGAPGIRTVAGAFFLFPTVVVLTYLILVEIVKARLVRTFLLRK